MKRASLSAAILAVLQHTQINGESMETKSALDTVTDELGYKSPQAEHFRIGRHGSKARRDKGLPKHTKAQRKRARAAARRVRKIRAGRAR